MRDIGLDVSQLPPWFPHEHDTPYVLVRVPERFTNTWADALSVAVRRCYVDDAVLDDQAERTGVSQSELVAAKLPDPGSTMSGDFGELLVFLYHAAREHPAISIGPKKWRLKQDRTKPAPFSDVIHFVVPSWPEPSDRDILLCSEVKTKATAGGESPLAAAIADCEKDQTSRLAKTLVWLKERALYEDLGSITVPHLDRFIRSTDFPPAQRHFRAVVVACASLIEDVLAEAPDEVSTTHTVVVIAVPDLKRRYEEVFASAHATVSGGEEET